MQSEVAGWFGPYWDHLHIIAMTNLPSSSAVMVYHKLAYAIIIRGSIAFWDQEKVVCRPLYPELAATSVLTWKRKQPFGTAAEKIYRICPTGADRNRKDGKDKNRALNMPDRHCIFIKMSIRHG